MAKDRVCTIDGCCNPVVARGWCSMHYQRWKSNGDPHVTRIAPRGEPVAWLRAVAFIHDSDECLIWPFGRQSDGYGNVEVDGRKWLAHRVVCSEVHGAQPDTGSEVAHSCGNGHLGCVAPKHLRWDTRAGNMADKILHNTHKRGERSYNAKLTRNQVLEIRKLSRTTSYQALGRKYGVSGNTVRLIVIGKRWGWLT